MKSVRPVMLQFQPAAERLWVIVWLLGLAACAKIADPQPPEVLIPKAATDLAARQIGSKIVLAVSMPVENTNGARTLTLGAVEVFRLAGDRSDTGPLEQDAFLTAAERIFGIPAARLAAFLDNGRLAFTDPSANDPQTLYSQGYRYAVRFINKHNQTSGLSNQAFIAPVPIPAAPDGLTSSVMRDRILLAWRVPARNADGSSPARIAGYNVYRTRDPKAFPPLPVNAGPLPGPEYEDREFEFDQLYYYVVTVVGSREAPYAESLPSQALAVTPRDIFPPGAPRNLSCVLQNGVVLLWEPPDDADLAGYRVIREEADGTGRMVLQDEPAAALSFRDQTAVAGKKYQYSVVAVDRKGNAVQPAVIQVVVQ